MKTNITPALIDQLRNYAKLAIEKARIEKEMKTMKETLTLVIPVEEGYQQIKDLLVQHTVVQVHTLSTPLIRTLLEREGREDLLEAATEIGERRTFTVKETKKMQL